MINKFLISLLLGFALVGCNANALLKDAAGRMAPDDDEALAKTYLAALRAGDVETATKLLDPQFVKPGVEVELRKLAMLLNQGDLRSLELVGCYVFYNTDSKKSALTYEYGFPKNWVLATITVQTKGATKSVYAVNVQPMAYSSEAMDFTLTERSWKHFMMLGLAVLVLLFILTVLIVCIRTPIARRKWLWILFILFGFGTLSLNWASGEFGFITFSVQMFAVSLFKQGVYAPWALSVSLPLGAIVFLVKRRKLIAEGVEAARAKAESLAVPPELPPRPLTPFDERRAGESSID